MGTKNLKGTVGIENVSKRIRLRWRFQKKRYSLNLFHFNKANLLRSKKIALQIENDLAGDNFDVSLNRYKPAAIQEKSPTDNTLVDHFQDWVKNYRNMDCDRDIDYYSNRSMMLRWGSFDSITLLHHFNNEKFAATTYNRRLTLLQSFLTWAEKRGIILENRLVDVLPKKARQTAKESRKPFTEKEIRDILAAIKNNKFCSKYTLFKHSHYYPFVFFMFKTGVRNAEAIGLRVKHVNLPKRFIEIKETLARTLKCSNASARISVKSGKTDPLRPFHIDPLRTDLKNHLTGRDKRRRKMRERTIVLCSKNID